MILNIYLLSISSKAKSQDMYIIACNTIYLKKVNFLPYILMVNGRRYLQFKNKSLHVTSLKEDTCN